MDHIWAGGDIADLFHSGALMTSCEFQTKSASPRTPEPDIHVTWAQWASHFNWVNWIGFVMFLLPIAIGYCAVHAWLWANDPLMFYSSMYVQLAMLCIAWKQLGGEGS